MTSAVNYLSNLRGVDNTQVENIVIYALSRDNYLKRPAAVTRRVVDEVVGACEEVEGVNIFYNGDCEGLINRDAAGGTGAKGDVNIHVLLNYSGRESIERRFAADNDRTQSRLSETLPFPIDLVVRSGGEMRLSDFCPWETAYAELISVEEMWPEVDRGVLERCLEVWAGRRRLVGREG